MAARTGNPEAIRAAATYVASNTWYATTAFQMAGSANTIMLDCTVATASAGNIEFYLQHGQTEAGTYFDLCSGAESPQVFGPVVVAGADARSIIIKGLPPGEYIKVYFRCSVGHGSATLGITAQTYLDEAGSMSAEMLGDIQVDTAAVEALLTTIAGATIVDDAAFTPGTTSVTMSGFTFDDATPDSVDEGDGGAGRMSANRNQYTTLRDAAGNERGLNIDASNQAAVVDAAGNTLLGTIDADTSNIPAQGTAAMAGATPVTLATDDTQYGAVGAVADVDGNVHGQLRFIGEAVDTLEAATLPTEGTTVDVDFDASVASAAVVAAGGVKLVATEDCYYVWGAGPTAVVGAPSDFLPAGVVHIITSPGTKIAAIKRAVAGKLSVTPLT